ncbi:16S rRNA (guanine(966)-N(2))-methyltransferase RsmD [Pseudidiomarina aestuarii]|uniref:Ribosomal RNA small subunit methyltransferase D n=1 Tax=Pseudidiomarina aestuarii TaxID=624146 RepID=A0A7Z6ZV77_9GAMM|nr:16S rRNA (guanine(966)-N(2))-methyltransferase RsmD [Pseudidiomarina aestuarii]RUO41936.1 16S rRNA (guanine(966)-N(2))-methyltransferase RsmD [Pseudidiomarina aestuarii]
MPRKPHKSTQDKNAGSLRIIGGQLRGRKLSIANVPGLRPTTDRIRETVFNWLQFEFTDAQVLDCFAGSGALGFEALSRGAQLVILVEQDRQATQLLNDHARTLSAACSGRALVQPGDVLDFLTTPPAEPMDIVFVDPPFRLDLVDRTVALLDQNQWVHEGSWVYIETEHDWRGDVPLHWRLHREKVAGQVAFRLFEVGVQQ